MKITILVDEAHNAHTYEDVHATFMEDYVREERDSLLEEFITGYISSEAYDAIFDMLSNCDSTYLNRISTEFENFLNDVEADWIEENYYSSVVDV